MTHPTDLSTAARRIVELGSKATAAPWRRVGKTGYINGRDDTASRLDAEVRVADVGAYRDKELLRFSRDRWDVDLDFIAFARNHAPALAADYLRLREVEKAARIFRIVWQSVCDGETKPPLGKGLEDSMACYDLAEALAALDKHRKETE